MNSSNPAAPAPAAPPPEALMNLPKGSSLWSDAWKRLRRNKLAIIGMIVLILIVLACFLGPAFLASGSKAETVEAFTEITNADHKHLPPGSTVTDQDGNEQYYLFGSDSLGRDLFVRTLYAGQTSLLVGLVATLASLLIGVLYGAIAGYYGGRVDEIMMRIVDFLYGIPYMFLVILIMLMFEETAKDSPVPVFFALGLLQWLTMARIVRGQVLTLREQEFVQAARVLGASDARIIIRHILPNVVSIVIVYATLTVPAVILLESFLSFLGLTGKLSWGILVSNGVASVNPIESHWWVLLFPSLMLALTLLCLNFVGDGLRDALDPKTRKE